MNHSAGSVSSPQWTLQPYQCHLWPQQHLSLLHQLNINVPTLIPPSPSQTALQASPVLDATPADSNIIGTHIVNTSDAHLSPGIDMWWWHQVFIPTWIQYLAWQRNPWAIFSRQGLLVIQIIRDNLFGDIPQEITANSVIYWLVHGLLLGGIKC